MTSDDQRRSKSPGRGDDRGRPARRGSGGGGRSDGRRGSPARRDDDRSTTTRGPVGIERAERTPGAPPRRAPAGSTERAPARPELPEDAEVTLPRAVVRELRRSARRPQDADEAALALSVGSDLLDEREGEEALAFLRWAKHLAPRSAAVREALGVALYLAEDYAGALSELQAYRRFTSRPDQNHLVADATRALGRGTDRIPELVEAMQVEDVPLDRRLEGLIVWASTLADDGDVGAGRAVLRRAIDEHDAGGEPDIAHLRVWYVAGDLAERAGDRDDARRHFSRITANAEGFFDVEDRLARLR
jgi:tetratricopeptide (TPR) repeat protein